MKFWERKHNRSEPVEDPSPRLSLRESVMDEGMKRLYQALTEATRGDAIVLPKMRLSHFLQVPNTDCLEEAIKMDRKCVDFLLCEAGTLKPLVVVQLSRSEPDKNSIDKFTTRALAGVDILVLQIQERGEYPVAGLRRQLIPRLMKAADSLGAKNVVNNASIEPKSETNTAFPTSPKSTPG